MFTPTPSCDCPLLLTSISTSGTEKPRAKDRVEAVASDNNCSKSEAVRQLVKHGLDNADIAAENRRLKEQLAATNQRIDANNELVSLNKQLRRSI